MLTLNQRLQLGDATGDEVCLAHAETGPAISVGLNRVMYVSDRQIELLVKQPKAGQMPVIRPEESCLCPVTRLRPAKDGGNPIPTR